MFDKYITNQVDVNTLPIANAIKDEARLDRFQKQKHHDDNLEVEKIFCRQKLLIYQGHEVKPKPKCIHKFKVKSRTKNPMSFEDSIIFECGCGLQVRDNTSDGKIVTDKIDKIYQDQQTELRESGWIE